jgi:hypothetical protein
MDKAGPLTDKDYEAINKQLNDLADAQLAIVKAAQAGCDVSDHKGHCDFLQKKLESIKAIYFPQRP